MDLVAQCSAIGVSVAATPPCSAICFLQKKKSLRNSDRGVARWVRLGFFKVGGATSPKLREFATTLCAAVCATLCSAAGVSERVCH